MEFSQQSKPGVSDIVYDVVHHFKTIFHAKAFFSIKKH